jgi:hypothetical protein
MDENQAWQAKPESLRRQLWRKTFGRFRLYMLPGYGITYRVSMRVLHRFGWHWHKANYGLEPGKVLHWCHWCGDRYEETRK